MNTFDISPNTKLVDITPLNNLARESVSSFADNITYWLEYSGYSGKEFRSELADKKNASIVFRNYLYLLSFHKVEDVVWTGLMRWDMTLSQDARDEQKDIIIIQDNKLKYCNREEGDWEQYYEYLLGDIILPLMVLRKNVFIIPAEGSTEWVE